MAAHGDQLQSACIRNAMTIASPRNWIRRHGATLLLSGLVATAGGIGKDWLSRLELRFADWVQETRGPRKAPQEALSSMTAQADELGVDRPMPIGPSQDHDPAIAATASEPPRIATTKLSNLISTSDAIVRLQAGEQATFTPDGVLLSRQA